MAAMGGARPGLSGVTQPGRTLWSDKPSGQARSSLRIVAHISRENINKREGGSFMHNLTLMIHYMTVTVTVYTT